MDSEASLKLSSCILLCHHVNNLMKEHFSKWIEKKCNRNQTQSSAESPWGKYKLTTWVFYFSVFHYMLKMFSFQDFGIHKMYLGVSAWLCLSWYNSVYNNRCIHKGFLVKCTALLHRSQTGNEAEIFQTETVLNWTKKILTLIKCCKNCKMELIWYGKSKWIPRSNINQMKPIFNVALGFVVQAAQLQRRHSSVKK